MLYCILVSPHSKTSENAHAARVKEAHLHSLLITNLCLLSAYSVQMLQLAWNTNKKPHFGLSNFSFFRIAPYSPGLFLIWRNIKFRHNKPSIETHQKLFFFYSGFTWNGRRHSSGLLYNSADGKKLQSILIRTITIQVDSKAAYYNPHWLFDARWWPLVAMIIMTAAKEASKKFHISRRMVGLKKHKSLNAGEHCQHWVCNQKSTVSYLN